MIPAHVAEALERAAEGQLDAEARALLLDALRGDPAGVRAAAAHLRLATRLAAALRPPDPALPGRVEFILRQQSESRRHRTLAAVESGLRRPSQRRRAPPRRRPAAPPWRFAVAAVVLCGVLLALLGAPSDRQAGDATLVCADAGASCQVDGRGVAHAEVPLRAGSAVRTRRGAALVRWADGTRVILEEEGGLVLERPDPGRLLTLDEGRLAAEVAPQPAGRPFTIRTPQAVITVVGTAFTAWATAASTTVTVRHGRVRVAPTRGGAPVEVGPGESCRFPPLGGPPAVAAAPAARERQLSLRPVATASADQRAPGTPHAPGQLQVKWDERGNAGYSRESFLRFDLGALRGRVAQATLRLHVLKAPAIAGVAHLLSLAPEAGAWQEGALTWNARPLARVPLGEQAVPEAGLPIAWDVTAALPQGGAGQATFCISASANRGPDSYCDFAGPDHERVDWQPRLELRLVRDE